LIKLYFCSLLKGTPMKRSNVKALLSSTETNRDVLLKGWVRTRRGNNQVAFIAVNDGTTIHNIQVVADLASFPEETMKRVTTGSSIRVTGKLVESMGKGQKVEIQAEVSEKEPNGKRIYTEQDKLEFLQKKNPELAKLKTRFNLDFDD